MSSTLPRYRRWGQSGRADPVAAYAAPTLGMKASAVEQMMKRLNHRCAAIVHAFKQLGDNERLAKFIEPIHRALEGREPPPNCDATWMLAEESDAAEDVDELRYQLDKSDANLAKLIKTKREMIRRETALLDTLLEEQRQRGPR